MKSLRNCFQVGARSLGKFALLICCANVSLAMAASLDSKGMPRVEQLAHAPLYFEALDAAEGSPDGFGFVARSRDASVLIAPAQATLLLNRAAPVSEASATVGDRLDRGSQTTHSIRITLLNANSKAAMNGIDRLPGTANYFIGNDRAAWRTAVPLFGRVQVDEVYSGIGLVYYPSRSTQLEYDFVVQPHADPSQIALRIEGANRLFLDVNGDLVMKVAGGEVRQRKPFIYQDVKGTQRAVLGGFRVQTGGTVRFWIGDYDRSRPLIIDPILTFSTFIGGTKADSGWAVAANDSGVYVAGETLSKNLIGAGDPVGHSGVYGGGVRQFGDGFVTRYDTNGALIYVTYLGGKGTDAALGIAADAAGHAFITGYTDSTNFPSTPGAFREQINTVGRNNNSYRLYPVDSYVTKLLPNGQLDYSTLFGGRGRDSGFGIAVDGAGNAWVTGFTESDDFFVTNIVGGAANVIQTTNSGRSDAFVVRFNSVGSDLEYATYLGGTNTEHGESIAVDSADGSVCITGTTTSTNFPVWNAIQVVNAQHTNGITLTNLNIEGRNPAFSDAFVTKLSPDGSSLVFSTYLGGTSTDVGMDIAVDAASGIYVTGQTFSRNFPTNVITLPRGWAGSFSSHVFVTKLDGLGVLQYSTEFGGRRADHGAAIDVDAGSRAYVAGATSSFDFFATNAISDLRAPLTNAAGKRIRFTGVNDVFLTVLSPEGTNFVHSVYLGGSGNDEARGLAVDAGGNAYLVGRTLSPNFPTNNPAQPQLGGGTRKSRLSDGFLSRISDLP